MGRQHAIRLPRTVEVLPPQSSHAPESVKDIAEVVHLLHDRYNLPLELIPEILEHAEYWTRTTAERCEHVRVSQFSPKEEPYVSVRVNGRKRAPLRKIVFETVSSDQGWSSGEQDRDADGASWTWFEADLEFEAGAERVPPKHRWIHTNVHGKGDATIQAKVWEVREGEEAAGWLVHAQAGDMLHVYPKAPYPGWVNYVDQVRVSAYCAWV